MPKETKYFMELLQAIQENNVDDVKYLIKSRLRSKKEKSTLFCSTTDVEERLTKEYDTAVMAATRLEDPTILKYMLKHGANINFVGDSGSVKSDNKVSPLHESVLYGLHATIAILLEANANVNQKDHLGRTPLFIAAKKADCESARMLLFRGANVHLLSNSGTSPLQVASKYGHVELVRVLLEHDAQIFEQGQKGASPIHVAASEGHIPLLDIFSHYVNINVKVACNDDTEKTALHLAAERGLTETVRFLLDQFNADITVLDSENQTALHSAVSRVHDYKRMRRKEDYDMVVDLLLVRRVVVNQQNKHGDTALHFATKNGYRSVVEKLLKSGADHTIVNKDKKLPKDLIPAHDVSIKQLYEYYEKNKPNVIYPSLLTPPCSPNFQAKNARAGPCKYANPQFFTTIPSAPAPCQ